MLVVALIVASPKGESGQWHDRLRQVTMVDNMLDLRSRFIIRETSRSSIVSGIAEPWSRSSPIMEARLSFPVFDPRLPSEPIRSQEVSRLMNLFGLGPRRAEVLWLILYGVTTDKAIAVQARMSPSVSHSHVQQLLIRFRVRDRASLVVAACGSDGRMHLWGDVEEERGGLSRGP